MTGKDSFIAVTDSGVGGVSVLRELVRLLPGEDFLYFGDTKNAPYGSKDPAEVCRLVFRVAEDLIARGAKALVLACNTATGAAAAPLRERYADFPIIGIEPALKPAAMVSHHPKVLVMATPLTLRQAKYEALEARFAAEADITDLPCPGLATLVEQGHLADDTLDGYLADLLSSYEGVKFDACVLGCTHYPHVREAIARHLPRGCVILDGGEGTARETRRRLLAAGLLSGREGGAAVRFENSAGDAASDALARALFER